MLLCRRAVSRRAGEVQRAVSAGMAGVRGGGVQASDGGLMGLGTHTQLNDRFGPRAKVQSGCHHNATGRKHAARAHRTLDTGRGTGQYLYEIEEYVGSCCG